MLGAIFWTMWLNRNDLIFNTKIISTLGALICWNVLVDRGGRAREDMEKRIEALMRKMDTEREVVGVG
jgi:hypothetical protein